MKRFLFFTIIAGLTAFSLFRACDRSHSEMTRTDQIAHGKYLVEIGGCNDCHAVGYAETGGNLPESEWLTGSPIGFRGPWGTTYPANLRLSVKNQDEETWIKMCKTRTGMPPMPWPSLNHMKEEDLRAIYQYIAQLGPKGEPAPLFVAPNQEPETPYIVFSPLHMERLAASAKPE